MMSIEIARLLRFAVEQGASDLHLSAGQPPILRIDGDLHRLDAAPLSAEQARTLVLEVMSEEQRKEFQQSLELDFSFALDGKLRFRVNAFQQSRGEGAVFRVVNSKIPDADALGLPDVIQRLADQEKGLILVTGPTGSGKSTTLAAIVDRINRTRPAHVLTLEDPIEFVHPSKR
jgi:twitching motility protein PilT